MSRLALLLALLLLAAPALAIQCSVPTGDEDNSTYYWDTPGSGSAHYTSIDEDTSCGYASEGGDTIVEDDGSTVRLIMGTVTDPDVHTGHTWTVRGSINSNKSHTVTADIYQGTTKLNTSTSCTLSDTWTASNANLQCTLTEAEASAITDYSNIRIYLTATSTAPTDVYVESVNFEVPNAAAGARSRGHVIGG